MTNIPKVCLLRIDGRGRTFPYWVQAIYLNKGHYEEWVLLDKREQRNETTSDLLWVPLITVMMLDALVCLFWLNDAADNIVAVDSALGTFAFFIETFLVWKPRLRSSDASCNRRKREILAHYGISIFDLHTVAREGETRMHTHYSHVITCN